MMTQRRTFIAEFKTKVVLDLVSGAHSAAELCRQHQLNPQLLSRWKTEFLERAALVFEQDQQRSAEQEWIAELERLVGRLTMKLDIAKKPFMLWLCCQAHQHSHSMKGFWYVSSLVSHCPLRKGQLNSTPTPHGTT